MKRKYIYTSLTVLLIILSVSFNSMASDLQVILTPRASVGGEFVSNVNLTPIDEEDDFVATIHAGATLEVLKKLSGLSLSYDPSFANYATNDQYNTWRHDLNLSAWTELTKTSRLQFGDSFYYTEDPLPRRDYNQLRREVEDPTLEDPLLEPDTTIRRGREVYWRNTARLDYSNQFSKYGSFNVGGSYSRLENKDPEILDNEEYTASVGLNYQIQEMKSIDLGASYTKGEYEGDTRDDFDEGTASVSYNQQFKKYLGGYAQYDHTIRSYDGDTSDYQVLEPTVGINYVIAENFTVDAGVGYFWRILENDDNTEGLTIDGNLGKTWPFKRGAISLTGSSGFDSQDFGAENLGFNKFYGATGRAFYDFSQYIQGDVSAGYLRNEYTDSGEDRDNYYAEAKLRYRILRWLSVSVGYIYDRVKSNFDENTYEDQRLFFDLTSALDYPIKLYPR